MRSVLYKYNFFILDRIRIYEKPEQMVLYAPLSGSLLPMSKKNLHNFAKWLHLRPPNDSFETLLSALIPAAESQLPDNPFVTNNFPHLSVLPNYRCNLQCVYCYSAGSRSGQVLSEQAAESAIHFFMNNRGIKSKSVSIFGGGEPLMTPELVMSIIEMVRREAERAQIKASVLLITNGTLLHGTTLKKILHYRPDVCISFEVIEEIQNLQRGMYAEVCDGITHLLNASLTPSFNIVITPANVRHQEEIVTTVLHRFQGVNSLIFEPVRDLRLFASPKELQHFYLSYTHYFFRAKALASAKGISITSSLLRRLDYITDRYCPGELCLTPSGDLTICPCVSSYGDAGYADYAYGSIDAQGKLSLDAQKATALTQAHTNTAQTCTSCFARWHCGGGCMHLRRTWTKEYQRVHCAFIRDVLLHGLLTKLPHGYSLYSDVPYETSHA